MKISAAPLVPPFVNTTIGIWDMTAATSERNSTGSLFRSLSVAMILSFSTSRSATRIASGISP